MAGRVDLKVVLLGKEYGGKTSLVERYLHGKFGSIPYQATIGAAFGAKTVSLQNGSSLTLGIWDTAGAERYEAMSRLYYRGAKAAVICFDLTDSSSFERARFWVNELKVTEENCKIFLCGTKYDLVQENRKARKVDAVAIEKFAEETSAPIWETSAKTGHQVDELFANIAEAFSENITPTMDQKDPATFSRETIDISASPKRATGSKSKPKCCAT
ncbi:ras-related protein Rab-24-like [Oscarella lobularis]|uniref:ras-related protein Rab-24-like n=1 Tax=Oscarella lobularis TaxID=121494 RepID=UPI00331388E8